MIDVHKEIQELENSNASSEFKMMDAFTLARRLAAERDIILDELITMSKNIYLENRIGIVKEGELKKVQKLVINKLNERLKGRGKKNGKE